MKTVSKRLYEGMFLVDSAEATADWDGVETSVKNILDRAEAEIVSLRKWEERRLAYEIDGKSKGTYILCYFRADGKRIGDIERDVHLSERIMRVLILCAEHMTQEDIEKETPVVLAERDEEKAAEAAVKETEAKQEIAQEGEETQEEVLEVSGGTAEKSEELGEPVVVAEGDKERMETPEPAATGASESEQAQGAEVENDSEAADEQDEEGTEEK